jgi:hypothetical protein
MSPPGGFPAPAPSDDSMHVEHLIREAHALLDEFGLELSNMKISRLCRTYVRRVAPSGHPFREFLLNSVHAGADPDIAGPGRRRVKGIPADPTGDLAVRNLATIEDAVQRLAVKPGEEMEIRVRRAGARVIRVRRNDVISGGDPDAT